VSAVGQREHGEQHERWMDRREERTVTASRRIQPHVENSDMYM